MGLFNVIGSLQNIEWPKPAERCMPRAVAGVNGIGTMRGLFGLLPHHDLHGTGLEGPRGAGGYSLNGLVITAICSRTVA